MESQISPDKAIQYLIDTAPLYAQAKSERLYLEEFRKSKKAHLMSQAGTEVLGKQETFAYAHEEYIEVLMGIKAAVEKEEQVTRISSSRFNFGIAILTENSLIILRGLKYKLYPPPDFQRTTSHYTPLGNRSQYLILTKKI